MSQCSHLRTYSLKASARESDLHRIQASPCSLAGQGTPSPPGRRKAGLVVQSFDSGSPTPSQESPTPEDTLSLARWLGVHWDRGLGKKHLLPSPLPPNCPEVPTWGLYLPMSGEIPGFAYRPLSDLWPWPPALSPAWGLPSCRPHRRCRACPSRPVRCKGQRVR